MSRSLDDSSLVLTSLPDSAGDRRIVSDVIETPAGAEEFDDAVTLGPRMAGTDTER